MAEKETQKDAVEEARALLNRVTLPAEVNAVARELLPKLCDEIEAHRGHLEFCFHNHVMESELAALRSRGHQTVKFECGCIFRQDGLDAEPQIIKHCASDAEQLMQLRKAHDSVLRDLKQAAFAYHVEANHKPSAFATCPNAICANACRVFNAHVEAQPQKETQ